MTEPKKEETKKEEKKHPERQSASISEPHILASASGKMTGSPSYQMTKDIELHLPMSPLMKRKGSSENPLRTRSPETQGTQSLTPKDSSEENSLTKLYKMTSSYGHSRLNAELQTSQKLLLISRERSRDFMQRLFQPWF